MTNLVNMDNIFNSIIIIAHYTISTYTHIILNINVY